ncbi:MAG: hypothetical protein K1X78_12945 [Verrucomicrobiaceae bacterium]|nr:hypothetical protein [Verrucomicrobiaceae bacterium]
MKNAAIVFLLLLVAAGIAIGGWFMSQPNPATSEIVRLEKELKDANAQIERLKEALDKMKTTVAASAPPVPSAGAPGAAGSESAPGFDHSPAGEKESGLLGKLFSSKSSGMSAFKEMMKNPGMKDMIKQQNIVQTELHYGGLFDHFKLTPEEKENFKQLLAARSGAQTEMGLKFMDENLTPAQRKLITDDFEKAKKASDADIRTFLGDEGDYQTFQHWEETAPERMQLQMMGGLSQFKAVGEPLTPEQEQKLIDVMAAARKSPGGLPDMSKPAELKPENMTDEMLQKLLAKHDHDAQTVVQNAAGFLSAKQLEALGKMQQQQRNMTEMGLKMSQTFMKGPSNK